MGSQEVPAGERRSQRRSSERLRALASSAYTATAGHLEIEPEERAGKARLRWFPEPSAAWILGLVLVFIAAAASGWAVFSPRGEAVPFGDHAAETGADAAAAAESDAAAETGADEGAVRESEDRAGADGAGGREAEAASPASASELDSASDADAAHEPADEPAGIVVHVAGAVAEPGVVELPDGARAGEAVDAAGGPLAEADFSRVNLARPLTDGEQLYLPRIGEESPEGAPAEPGTGGVGPGAVAGTGADPEDEAPVNINTADSAGLEALPGIGPARAQAIVEWRETNGGFSAAEELMHVSGIGPATLERLAPLVSW